MSTCSLETVCLTTAIGLNVNQVLKMSSETCQQFVEDAVKISIFLDFRLSQVSVATYCRSGGNL